MPSLSTLPVAMTRNTSHTFAAIAPHRFPFRAAAPQPACRRCVCASAQRQKKPDNFLTKRGTPKPAADATPPSENWNVLRWDAYARVPKWEVPWGVPTIVSGMLAWGVSFVLVGFLSVPVAVQLFHFPSLANLSALEQSEVALLDQVISTGIAIAIVTSIGARAGEDKPDDFLRASLEAPFRKPDGWLTWALVGIAMSPFAILVASLFIFVLFPEGAETGRGTVDGVADMISVDGAVFTNLLCVTGVLAPILEETIFRGFLLTSLTKYLSIPASVVVSSAMFAACHLSVKDFPQLMALGMIMGFMYCRSRNLLTSILIHGAWNSGVLSILFALVSSGVSMDEILGK